MLKYLILFLIPFTLSLRVIQSPQNNTNITNITVITNETYATLPIKQESIVTFESKAYPNSYMKSEVEDCKNKKDGEQCGDNKGLYGSDSTTQFKVYTSGNDIYCFESVNFPTAFLYTQIERCNNGDTECGDIKFKINKSDNCNGDIGYKLVPINDQSGVAGYVIQSATKTNVFARGNFKDCLNQGQGGPTDHPRECGDTSGRWAASANVFKPDDPEVFYVHVTS
jgi:hypothetical protein